MICPLRNKRGCSRCNHSKHHEKNEYCSPCGKCREDKMKIIKIGTWEKNGQPIGWIIDIDNKDTDKPESVMTLTGDDKVLVDRVEIVEWTKERKRMMAGGRPRMINADAWYGYGIDQNH